MTTPLNPLTWNVPIVNEDGTPTQEFMRKWQLQIDVNAAATVLTTAAKISAVLDILSSIEGSMLVRNSLLWGGLASPSNGSKFLSGTTVPAWALVNDSDLAVTDTITNNSTTLQHGFMAKLSGVVGTYMNGTGTWTTPPGSLTELYVDGNDVLTGGGLLFFDFGGA